MEQRQRRLRTWILALALGLAAPAIAQPTTKQITFEWDYIGTTPAVVKTWAQTLTIDGTPTAASIGCAVHPSRPADVTCSVLVPALAAGPHTVTVSATAGGHTATSTITGVDLAKVPQTAGSPRINVTLSVTFP